MPDRRLGAAHRGAAQIVPEHALGGGELDCVGHRRSAVGVDIVDVARLHPRLLERHPHRDLGALALGMRRGDVIGVARQAVADDLGIDFRAACLGVLIFLEHHHARALAHDKAVAALVVGAAGLLRPVVEAHVERARLGETRDPERIDRSLGAPRKHDVGVVILDHPRRVADRMRPGRASGNDRVVGTHQPVFDADLPADQIDQPAMDKVRADAAGTLFGKDQRFALNPREAADPRADRATGAKLGLFVHLGQPGVLERLAGSVDAIDDERVDLALNLVIDALARVEAVFVGCGLDLARDGAFLVARVEPRDRARARFPRDQVAPRRLDVPAERSDETQSSNDDTTHHILRIAKQAQTRTGRACRSPVLPSSLKKGGPSTSAGRTVREISPCCCR